MAIGLDRVVFDIIGDTKGIDKSLNQTEMKAKKTGEGIDKSMSDGSKNASNNVSNNFMSMINPVMLVTGAVFGTLGAIVKVTNEVDKLYETMAKSGFTTEQVNAMSNDLLVLAGIAKTTGVDLTALQKASMKVTEMMATSPEIIEQYGVSLTDAEGIAKSSAQVNAELAKSIHNIEDPTLKAQAALDIYGAKGAASFQQVSIAISENEEMINRFRVALDTMFPDGVLAPFAELSGTLDNLKMTIGILLAVALYPLTKILNIIIVPVVALAQAIMTALMPVFLALQPIVRTLLEVFQFLADVLAKVFHVVGVLLVPVMWLLTIPLQIINGILQFFVNVVNVVILKLKEWFYGTADVTEQEAIQVEKTEELKNKIGELVTKVTEIKTAISTWITETKTAIVESDAFKAVVGFLGDAIEKTKNFIIGFATAINDLIRLLRDAAAAVWDFITPFDKLGNMKMPSINISGMSDLSGTVASNINHTIGRVSGHSGAASGTTTASRSSGSAINLTINNPISLDGRKITEAITKTIIQHGG